MKNIHTPTHRGTPASSRAFQRLSLTAVATLSATGLLSSGVMSASAATSSTNAAVTTKAATAVMPQGVFKGRASDDLFYSNGKGQFERLTFESWKRIGFPRYTVLPNAQVLFLKYAFSSNVYQVIQFGTNSYSVSNVSHAGWLKADAPRPSNAKYIPGARVVKYQAGDDLFFYEPNGARTKLTMNTWAQTGYQGYVTLQNVGYQRLSWNDNIAYMSDVARGQGHVLDFKQWADLGAPKPQLVERFPGDQFYRYSGSDKVYYQGPTLNRAVSFAEWAAAGAPAPSVRISPALMTTQDLSKHAVVDLSDQKVYAYNGGHLLNSFTVTTGKAGHVTPTGVGKVWFKTQSQTMTGGSKANGTYYSVPNVQWVSYFNGDIAFHAAYWRSEFGGDPSVVGSHGCINMRTEDAKWMYDFAGYGTKVVVQN